MDATIVTADGMELAATTYTPADEPDAVVVVLSAMAVPRRFYDAFAAWLADEGLAVVTFDFRGTGGSGPDDLVGYETSIEEWIERDAAAVIEWARAWSGADDLYLVGHSLGGQVMGLLGDRFEVDAAATFCAQSGYWRLQYPGEEWKLWMLTAVIMPVVTHLLGYLPWSAVFGGEDIPKTVALQWAAGCRHPDYLLGDAILADTSGFARFSAPILAYSFDDDVWGYEKAVDAMMDHYTAARVERMHVVPEEVGVEKIGHFGFFREEMSFLWGEFLERLESL